jgi:hypothetical protein
MTAAPQESRADQPAAPVEHKVSPNGSRFRPSYLSGSDRRIFPVPTVVSFRFRPSYLSGSGPDRRIFPDPVPTVVSFRIRFRPSYLSGSGSGRHVFQDSVPTFVSFRFRPSYLSGSYRRIFPDPDPTLEMQSKENYDVKVSRNVEYRYHSTVQKLVQTTKLF